jgi:hypothetical protein
MAAVTKNRNLSSNFNYSYLAMGSLTYIPNLYVKFFVRPIHTDSVI